MIKIAHILGGWSVNIGNAFFQLGGLYAINKVMPASQTILIGEKPGYPSYWNREGGNPTNYFDWGDYLDIDYLVMMGPIFRPEIKSIWDSSLSKMMAKGTKLILLGMGMMDYDKESVGKYREFLKQYRPYIFVSRDNETFEKLSDLAESSYNGIDFGFFISDVYNPVGISGEKGKRIILNFDKMPEPKISISSSPLVFSDYDFSFTLDNKWWGGRFSKIRKRLSETSRYFMFLEGLFPGNGTHHIQDYEVLRTDHRPHPLFRRKTYRYPNMMVNDVPYSYLELYSSAFFTLSNRVHACVAALSYGNNAMLFSKSPRSKLMERLGLGNIIYKPVNLNREFIAKEKGDLLKYLTERLAKKEIIKRKC